MSRVSCLLCLGDSVEVGLMQMDPDSRPSNLGMIKLLRNRMECVPRAQNLILEATAAQKTRQKVHRSFVTLPKRMICWSLEVRNKQQR